MGVALACGAGLPTGGSFSCLAENTMATKKSSSKQPSKKTPVNKSAPRRSSAASKTPKNEAIAQLTADHARVKKLFKQYDRLAKAEASDKQKQDWRR